MSVRVAFNMPKSGYTLRYHLLKCQQYVVRHRPVGIFVNSDASSGVRTINYHITVLNVGLAHDRLNLAGYVDHLTASLSAHTELLLKYFHWYYPLHLFNNFNTKIPGYATTLDLSPGDLSSVADDSAMVEFAINGVAIYKAEQKEWVDFKDLELYGPLGRPTPAVPTVPVLVRPARGAPLPAALPRQRPAGRRVLGCLRGDGGRVRRGE